MSFARNLSNKYGKQLLDTGLDSLKTASKKAIHKTVKKPGEFVENKISDKIALIKKNKETH